MSKGIEERYKSFINECNRIADAYGITLDQYMNVTLNRNIIDFEEDVKFNQVFEWEERYTFLEIYNKKRKNHVKINSGTSPLWD